MAMNRLIDRRLDALNPRTQARELPSGRMSGFEAWALLVASGAAYVAACAALGPWFLRVAPVPLVVFAAYPYLKRFTPLCHFGVGLALALAPLAGFAAAHPDLAHPGPALWLAVFALVWVSGFDIIYATLDESFDRGHGVHSMVAWLGRDRAMLVSRALHLVAAFAMGKAVLLLLGPLATQATWGGALTVALGLGTGYLLYLEQRWAEDVNLAFFKVNVWVGLGVLLQVLAARLANGGF